VQALERERQERIGAGRGRPGFLVEAADPESVELEAGSLPEADDLEGSGLSLRLERGSREDASELTQGLAISEVGRNAVQASEAGKGFIPSLEGLELVAGKGTLAGPA